MMHFVVNCLHYYTVITVIFRSKMVHGMDECCEE